MATQKPNLWGLLSDSFRVIKSHPLHFLALAALFIFPNALLAIVYPFLINKSSVPPNFQQSLLSVYSPDPQNGFLVTILYGILSLLFSFSAIASITYTTFRIYYGKPVKFLPSLKQILVSFLPLLATNLIMALVFGLIGIVLGSIAFLAYNALTLLGLDIDDGSTYFLVLISIIIIGALYFFTVIYLQVKWFLSTVIVVVENEWGLKPLKRSSYLVKGMQWVVLSTILLFLIPGIMLSLWYYSVIKSVTAGEIGWVFVVSMIIYAGALTTLSLYSMVVQTVLFAYSKAWHGETVDLGLECYTKLPGDEV